MAVGFRGGSSGGSSGGIDFDSDYFNVPVVPLNQIIPRTDYSAPVTGGGDAGVSSSDFMANVPVNYKPVTKPVDYGLYQGLDQYTSNFSGPESATPPSYFTTDSLTDQDIENYLSDTENFVYNPGTGDFEPAGKYTYPLSQLAPGYSDTQEKFMLGIKPGMTGQQLQDIEANKLNVQKLAFETGGDPDAMHTAYTGFTPDGTFVGNADNPINNDPVTQAFNNIPDYGAGGNEGPGGSNYTGGSVFDDGGAFGGKQ